LRVVPGSIPGETLLLLDERVILCTARWRGQVAEGDFVKS
jgi:hypothetical protein